MSLPITNRAPNGSNEFFKDTSIKNLIHGSFLKLGILTSDVSFTKVCTGETTIQFLYYPPQISQTGSQILPLINLLGLILKLREPKKNYKFVCVKAAHKFVDSKILNDYIFYMVLEDPSRLKNVVNYLLKEYKLITTDPSGRQP